VVLAALTNALRVGWSASQMPEIRVIVSGVGARWHTPSSRGCTRRVHNIVVCH